MAIKRNRIVTIFIVLSFIIGAWLFLRFVIGGPEDNWICDNGQWIKHGNPRAPMPIEGCGQQLKTELNSTQETGSNLVSESPEEPSQKVVEKPIEPEILLLDVPFLAQAPFGQWSDPIYQNACEEAALLMAILWINGIKSISKEEATLELKKFADFEIEKYSNFYDHSMADTGQLMRDYFGYDNIEYRENIVAEDIINQLLNGNLVIVPINGQILKNPFYTPPGPVEHMLLIIGYDWTTEEFITNDAGTRQGEKYRYNQAVLWEAIRDYPTGYKEPITEINKVMLVIKK
ncbi:MAG: hypothetical protein A2V60_01170 [Candidatus Portnoybacteria bacterium RIFCSPHIGHO2_01_FULL_39_19]|nr:MAG: hypothetical protein A2V60_01170 [Candidatus Portnoybacteria bacterium RIFCSPHIGHO2_01_FULL_39_19]